MQIEKLFAKKNKRQETRSFSRTGALFAQKFKDDVFFVNFARSLTNMCTKFLNLALYHVALHDDMSSMTSHFLAWI